MCGLCHRGSVKNLQERQEDMRERLGSERITERQARQKARVTEDLASSATREYRAELVHLRKANTALEERIRELLDENFRLRRKIGAQL